MAIQNPPIFLQAGEHPAEDVRRFIGAVMLDRPGIVGSDDLAVSQNGTPNMTTVVAAGRAFVRGSEGSYQGLYMVENRGSATVTHDPSDPTNPRRDLVVLKVQDAAYSGAVNEASLAVVKGTPAGSPVDPTPPDNCLVLARVTVGAGATAITNANITDLRTTPSLFAGNRGGRAAALGGVVVCTSSTRPQDTHEGMVIYETDTDRLVLYNGSSWQPFAWGQSGIITGSPAGWSVIHQHYLRMGNIYVLDFRLYGPNTHTKGTVANFTLGVWAAVETRCSLGVWSTDGGSLNTNPTQAAGQAKVSGTVLSVVCDARGKDLTFPEMSTDIPIYGQIFIVT